jgi:hypothetical protein
VARTRIWLVLVLCSLLGEGCLGYRLTAAQVVLSTRGAALAADACHFVLDIQMQTDLLNDSMLLEVWERAPGQRRVQVLAANNPQLDGIAFATDGDQSTFYSPHAQQVLMGPTEIVQMPSVIERLIDVWREWIERVEPEEARLVSREREEGLVVYRVEIPLAQRGHALYSIDARQWWVRDVLYQDDYLGSGHIRVRQTDCWSSAKTDLPDWRFTLDLPDAVPVVEVAGEDNRPLTLEEAQLAVSFPLRTPTYVPRGTDFSAAYQLDKNMALVYLGERPFTLVQGPFIGVIPEDRATPIVLRGRPAAIIQEEGQEDLVLVWQESDLKFSIAGSLSREEALRIAESLRLTFRSAEAKAASELTHEQEK